MYTPSRIFFKYISYLLNASNGKGHGTHSPFVFDFIVNLLRHKGISDAGFDAIELSRERLLKSADTIMVKDLGAGSAYAHKPLRNISRIAKHALKSPKYAQLLYRMIRYYNIESVIELGTSLGITTQYLALAEPKHGVVTLEGAPEIAAFASDSFIAAECKNIRVICGDFKDHFSSLLTETKGRKLIFFDGNHQYEATMEYFNAAVASAHEGDIFVFDDVHWSAGMERAWSEIQENEAVACTIDLFFIGIVFFKTDFYQKQDFVIRF
jgi:predicted O-methyltransferase YrrM